MKPLIVSLAALAALAPPAHASERCVGGPHCAPTLQAALDAARPGDTIRLGRGTFRGGVTISRSVNVIGAGAGATVIRGGGPVIRVDNSGTVALIQGVTITGGVTTTSDVCGSSCGPDYQRATAIGGGVLITPGPTVTIRDAEITGNRAAPQTTVDSVRAPCPGAPCRFALAAGGGIANWGTLTLTASRVTGNEAAGPLTSDADGGGIYGAAGSLTVDHSVLSGNRATAVPPYGRFAEGGGMFINGGSLTVRGSVVDGNAAALTSGLPAFAGETLIDMNANSGGIHVGDEIPTTVEATALTNNAATANDPAGEPLAFDSAMLIGHSAATLSNVLVSGNRTQADTLTTADTGPGGSALELDGGGTISGARIVGNRSDQHAANGDAGVNGALAILNFDGDPALVTMSDSTVSGNVARAATSTGQPVAQGGGVFNNSLLTLRRVVVSNNALRADGPGSRAEGGGIWNGDELSGPPVQLALDHVLVTHNSLAAATREGGGVFTTYPLTSVASLIDDCSGC